MIAKTGEFIIERYLLIHRLEVRKLDLKVVSEGKKVRER